MERRAGRGRQRLLRKGLQRARGPHARADRGRVPLRRRRCASSRRGSGRRAPAAGPARFAVAGHAACQTACADLALQDIRPDRSLAAALEKVAALRAQPNGPRMMLYTGGRLAAGLDATAASRETARYASLLASAPVPVYPAVSEADADAGASPFRTSFANFLAPFGGGPPAPGVDSTHIPRRSARSGRPHALRVRLDRARGSAARDRDRQLGRLAGGKRPAPESARAPATVAGRHAGGREGARDPRDRGRQPGPQLPQQPPPQHRDRRRRHGQDAGRGRRLRLLLRAAGGEPRLPDLRRRGGFDPRLRDGHPGLSLEHQRSRQPRTAPARCSATAATCSQRST